MDAIVAEPYGLDRTQRDNDYAHVTKLSETLLVELSNVLNDHHKTSHSSRYWHIVLGFWLRRYTSVIVNRWCTLQQAFQNYEISGTAVFDATSYSLATLDSVSFIWACNDDVWNHVLYSRMLSQIASVIPEIEKISLGGMSGFRIKRKLPAPKGRQFKHLVLKTTRILQVLSRNTDAFIINSYLPKKEEIKLQLSLGQVPQLWQSLEVTPTDPDLSLRKRLALNTSSHQGLERCARSLLIDALPSCYLEGYKTLNQHVKALPWPKKPRFIFTSNNFDTDEIFKIWAGSKAEQGTPYFIGQHGNNYGTLEHLAGETECVAASDKFVTWGWTDGDPKHTPAFIFKTAGRKKPKTNKNGGLLLIERCIHHRIYPWDSYPEFYLYQDEQFRFVENLPYFIQKNLTVRLHTTHRQFAWSDEERWKERSPSTRIEDGSANIWTLISNNRLIVYSCDSTGVLEALSLNIPILCFWRGESHHLRPSAKPYYQLLRDAGILFDTPEQAAEYVSLRWDNVGEWWESPDTQYARKMFCQRYARTDATPVLSMRKLLTEMEADHARNAPRPRCNLWN